MALRVVARYFGEPVARGTARHMEYPFPEDNRAASDQCGMICRPRKTCTPQRSSAAAPIHG